MKEHVQATRATGRVAIVMAATVGNVSTCDTTKITSHDGFINITKTWAVSPQVNQLCQAKML